MRHRLAPPWVTGDLANERWWPPTPLDRYPHMPRSDHRCWDRWLRQNHAAFTALAYDVRVGHPWDTTPEADDDLRAIAADLTRLRADVIAAQADQLLIIEVKPHLTPGALGQALVYQSLLDQLDPQPANTIAAVLCCWAHPALLAAARDLDIIVFESPEPADHHTIPPFPRR